MGFFTDNLKTEVLTPFIRMSNLKNINTKLIMPFMPFMSLLFYSMALAIGFCVEIDSSLLAKIDCLTNNFCTEVHKKNKF